MVLEFKIDLIYHLLDKSKIPIISVNGEIDVYTSAKLDKTLKDVIEKGGKTIILNLENVHYIDSMGLGIIAHSADSISTKGGRLNVVCTKPQIQKIFQVSGLSEKNITLFDQESAALAETN